MNRIVIGVSLLSILGSVPAIARHSNDPPAAQVDMNHLSSGLTAAHGRNAAKPAQNIENIEHAHDVTYAIDVHDVHGAEQLHAASENSAAHALSLASDLSKGSPEQILATISNYGPWLTKEGISNNAQQLIRAIQDAQVHGLNPESYGLIHILETVDSLALLDEAWVGTNSPQVANEPQIETLRDELKQLLDTAFAKLIMHHGQGLVDAREIQYRLFRDVPQLQPKEHWRALTSGQRSVMDALQAVKPSHSGYRRLTHRMRDLLTERASGVRRTTIEETENIWAVRSHEDVMSIKRRLLEVGDLSPSISITPFIDVDLTDALKHFQQRNGLSVSGIADSQTRVALNISIEEEITDISLSLERWRWMPRDLGHKYLFVNIPDYRVVLKEGEQTTLSMAAVVGSIEYQTPAFTRDMSYLEFNPTWTVPTSITNRDLIPRERRNPGYLASRQFDYFEKINEQLVKVPSEQVTINDFYIEPFPYVLQQRGGPRNALGRMKFMMPNPYSIYLHDTQAKEHFSLNERAFSNGCIRLSEPAKLAQILMAGDGYSPNHITNLLAAEKTQRVNLRSPIPTHLTYMTTWVDDNGKLQRRADIYNHNAALVSALRGRSVSPSTAPILAPSKIENTIALNDYGP